ncbi:NAD(P)/FAD-dependent oxidoreductase [Desulfococcaceae bacterium HSG9]|nr:NAD(P)/FAD-dependent oxidoreductase [Desulfococcaceae bacterium HSG9]
MTTTTYDICIIGAGPGGLHAGAECARNGLTTIILDKKKTVGRPVHCGECLSATAVQNIGLDLPAEVIAQKVRGVRIVFTDGSARKIIESGYVLNKDKFEQWLAHKARLQGCLIGLNDAIYDLKCKDDRWEVSMKSGERYFTKIIIDASGAHSVANKCLRLNPPYQTQTGLQYTVDGIETGSFLNFYLWPYMAPGGYVWMIPKSGKRANVGLVTSETSGMKARLNRFLYQTGVKNYKITKISGGRIPVSGPLAATFTNRLLIIGDAAGFTSPVFKGGTYLALKSGCLAASVAVDALKNNDFSEKRFSGYQRLWKQHFPNYEALLKGRRLLNDFSESRLNMLARYMPDNVETISVRQRVLIGLEILFTNPALLIRGGPQIMKAFEFSRAQWYGW